MLALVFRFPASRYHATPWGRNVNEGAEPWRILRALIATWWRKADRNRWSEDDLAVLIDALAEQPPIYRLPENAIHTNTRHYMPQGKIEKGREATALVFDAFARLPANSEIIVAWPELALPDRLFALTADVALGIGYLGRAESWADCEARAEWNATAANCLPEGTDKAEGEPVRLIAPRAAADYADERRRLLAACDERERQAAIIKGKKPPTANDLAQAQRRAFGATLPPRLADALTLDTSDYQRFGWSRPPASRELVYLRQALAPTPRAPRRKAPAADSARFTVARFVLAGRPRPQIEDAVKIGELIRLAALAQFGWTKDEATGRSRPNAPWVISGRDAENRPLREPEHRHAFWLPEDADGDGEIDHVVVYAQEGFCSEVRRKLDRLTKLWIEPAKRVGGDGDADQPEARQEWRLALEGFGRPADFADASSLLGKTRTWESVTPFLASGHLKAGGYPAEIRRLLSRREFPDPTEVMSIRPNQSGFSEGEGDQGGNYVGVIVRGRVRRAVHFHRFRSRGREEQPDTIGTFLRLTFRDEIEGPLALGYACHFGLGLFRATG
jgi:CRISPR-associated protein Csb2